MLIEGKIVTSRRVGDNDVEVARTGQRGVYTGAFMAYLGDRVPQAYANSMRVTEPSRFYVLGADCFAQIMNEWFPMPVHLLEGLFFGSQRTKEAVGQRERLLALGSLTAGLTHELNNPAAAAVRATSSLRERVAGMRQKLKMIASGKYDKAKLEPLIELQQRAAEQVAKAPKLDPMEASDREDEVTDWLEDHGCHEGWQLAPVFVQAGLYSDWLDHVLDTVGADMIEPALRWLNYTVETELLMNEIEDATTRVSTLVGAAKQYSQLDRAPFQVVDVHDLLSSTLLMMSAKIKGIKVVKDYDKSLPKIPAYASELNQVWTNLIDNAAAAMNGSATGQAAPSPSAPRATTATCSSRSATPAPAYRRRSRSGSSSRSSAPSRSARAPGSASTSPGGSSSRSITATCASSRSPATPASRSGCPSNRKTWRPHDRTDPRRRPDRPAERHRLRGMRGGGRLVAAPAPLYAVRAHRLLRQLAGPARDRALQGDRPPGDPQLRAGRELVLVLPQRGLLRDGPRAARPAAPSG